MSTTSTDIDNLRTDFIIGISIVGGTCLILVITVIILIIWNIHLTKQIQKLDPFVNFKLQRPKIFHEERPIPEPRPYAFDNPGFSRNPLSSLEKKDLNPIAIRSKASFDNGNFSFGNSQQLSSNSFKSPDYLDLDSKFY